MEHRNLTSLLARSDIWRAASLPQHRDGLNTGFQPLNQALHQGGWPRGGLVEILPDRLGSAELFLLTPCLAQLSQRPGWLVFIAPPYIPYAPAWVQQGVELKRIIIVQPSTVADLLWSTEQALRASGNSVISWLSTPNIPYRNLRKLQLASQNSSGLSALIRPSQYATQNSPSQLRMTLKSHASQLQLEILKQQGGWAGQQITLPLCPQLSQTQLSAEQLPVHPMKKKSFALAKGRHNISLAITPTSSSTRASDTSHFAL